MATNIADIQAVIERASAPGFRDGLLARGQARSMIWRDGALPPNAPEYSPRLSHDLFSYGFGLLGLGLRLRELDGSGASARQAFEQAASALEAVIARGEPNDANRSFYFILTASAYHLARLSARAYSVLRTESVQENFSTIEKAISSLILRDFTALERQIVDMDLEGAGADRAITIRLASQSDQAAEGREDNDELLLEAINRALVDSFLRAMALFLFGLERGHIEYVDQARALLAEGTAVCADLQTIPQWWAFRVASHLIKDLWACSFHEILPLEPLGLAAPNWKRMRDNYIALLLSRKKAEIEFWPSQIDGAKRAVDQSDDLVVSLPTSAGKTRIAELCILRCLASGKRAIFITPLRALSAQTEVVLQRTFVPLGKTISSLYGAIGVNAADKDVMKTSDIVIATPEKLDFAIRNDPALLNDVGLIVLDEGHMIGTNEREIRYEVQIQRLLRRADAAERRIVCLSAILPDGDQLDDFCNWLRRDQPGGALKSEWRPTRLRFGEVIWYEVSARLNLRVGDERPFVPEFLTAFRPPIGQRTTPFPKNQNELCLATAWRLVEGGQTVLIFCPIRRSVEPFARAVVDLNKRGALPALLSVPTEVITTALALGREWLGADHPVLKCLELGVAIHHGALPTAYRKEVERLLRDGILKVTISSPTLAQGLNLTATSVVIHSLFRNREPIPTSEFKNVIGRAGRAFVDVEGLILHPIYDERETRLQKWETLISDVTLWHLESGLVRLVVRLLERMIEKLGKPTLDELLQYIVNNTATWDFPVVSEETTQTATAERRTWDTHVTTLDTALLSLIGEEDIADADLEAKLDELLASSLWERSLQRRPESVQTLVAQGLKSRARFIWANSTPAKRRGYFLAGLGLQAGHALDAIAPAMNEELVRFNAAVLNGDVDIAITSATALAENIFAIEPFIPDVMPTDWRMVLAAWLRGEPLVDLASGQEDDVLRFVENALVYRLPWAMEALRVRASANGETVGDFDIDDLELGVAVAAVETGTLSTSASLLIRAGFGSRIAAIKAVNDTAAGFASFVELHRWLRSEVVRACELAPDWPTAETRPLWNEFKSNLRPTPVVEWTETDTVVDALWVTETPRAGTSLRVAASAQGTSMFFRPDGHMVGMIGADLNPDRQGHLRADVMEDSSKVRLRYFGPSDLFRH
jgi:superfamily II DNA/RNA helicase